MQVALADGTIIYKVESVGGKGAGETGDVLTEKQ